MGISGRIARFFLASQLTPLIALVALLLGLFAVMVTPREEEPQIDVTMANVMVPFPGAPAEDVETLVSTPLEQVLSEIEGVKHVYSVSRPGGSLITVEFAVGVPRQDALVRLYNQVYSNADWAPPGLGVGQPLTQGFRCGGLGQTCGLRCVKLRLCALCRISGGVQRYLIDFCGFELRQRRRK